MTLRQAVRLYNSIWNSSPFLPWALERSDGLHLDGEGPASGEIDDHGVDSFNDLDEFSNDETFFSGEINSGKHLEKKNSFRRLFYRVSSSLRVISDWNGTGNSNVFYGVTNASEYTPIATSSIQSIREIEEGKSSEHKAVKIFFSYNKSLFRTNSILNS